MFLIWSFLTIPKHIFSISIFLSLQRDDHLCWNFFFDLLRASVLVLSKLLPVFLVICCSDFVSRRDLRFLLTLRVDQLISLILDMIRFAGCCSLVSWWIFSNNRRRPFRSRPFSSLNFFSSFDCFGRFCLLLCHCIILTWNPIDYLLKPLLLVVHQRIYCLGISSLWL